MFARQGFFTCVGRGLKDSIELFLGENVGMQYSKQNKNVLEINHVTILVILDSSWSSLKVN